MIRVRNIITKGLKEYMKVDAYSQDNIKAKPLYPFLTYKFIVPYIQPRGTGNISTSFEASLDERFEYDVVETLELQPTMTLSINAYSRNQEEAYNTMKGALDWFKHAGYMYLSDNNIVVVSVEAVGDRSVLIVDEYEVRYGFDVILRFTDNIDLRYENIEEVNIKKEIN